MYECNALAMIAEQAGGKATDGKQRILDIQPESLHQRVPFFVGSKHMVEEASKQRHSEEGLKPTEESPSRCKIMGILLSLHP